MNSELTTIEKMRLELEVASLKLRTKDFLPLIEVCMWLGENINAASAVTTGSPGRRVSYDGAFNYNLLNVDSKPVLHVKGYWYYTTPYGQMPELEPLNQVLPKIRFKKPTSRAYDDTLHTEFTLDLEDWPGLVVSSLHRSFDYAQNTDIEFLLQNFYPQISPGLMQTAYDLGMLENEKAWVEWLKSTAAASPSISVHLPSDIVKLCLP